MHLQGLNRWQAFAIHLAISAVIFLILLAIFLFFWYPSPFINMGGWQGIKIVAAVDLVLGPALTLIVFNPIKKSLKMDLSIIAVIQISCLIYGVWIVEQQRPMAQVLLDDTLFVITKADLKEQEADISLLDDLPGPTPKLVMLDMPMDQTVIATTLVTSLFTGVPLEMQTDKYLSILRAKTDDSLNERLEWLLNRLNFDSDNQCYWLPVESPHYTDEACFDPKKGAKKLRIAVAEMSTQEE